MRQGRLQLQRRLLLPLPLRGPSGPAGNEARVEKKMNTLAQESVMVCVCILHASLMFLISWILYGCFFGCFWA
jgi:hypothetical protein